MAHVKGYKTMMRNPDGSFEGWYTDNKRYSIGQELEADPNDEQDQETAADMGFAFVPSEDGLYRFIMNNDDDDEYDEDDAGWDEHINSWRPDAEGRTAGWALPMHVIEVEGDMHDITDENRDTNFDYTNGIGEYYMRKQKLSRDLGPLNIEKFERILGELNKERLDRLAEQQMANALRRQ